MICSWSNPLLYSFGLSILCVADVEEVGVELIILCYQKKKKDVTEPGKASRRVRCCFFHNSHETKTDDISYCIGFILDFRVLDHLEILNILRT